MLVESNPRLAAWTRRKLRVRSPAPESRITASAISPTTNPWCSRRLPRPPSARGPSSRSTSAGLVIESCKRGQQTRDEAAADRGGQQEQQHAHVEADGVGPRQRSGCEVAKRHRAAPRDEQSDRAGQQRQHDVLGERLADQPHPAGAKGRSHRKLRSTRRRARQHEARDVRTRDQQDEPHRPEQQPERTLRRRANHAIGERIRQHAEAGVGGGVLTAQLRGNRVHFGACRFD